jgi:hypothetical protein
MHRHPRSSQIAKAQREAKRAEKRQAKLERRAARRAGDNETEQFPSLWPDAPEPVAGVARTLSRGA